MATVQHPAFPDVTREVDEGDIESWLDAGWLTATPVQPDSMDSTGDEHDGGDNSTTTLGVPAGNQE